MADTPTTLGTEPGRGVGFILVCTTLLLIGGTALAWGGGWIVSPLDLATSQPAAAGLGDASAKHRHTALGLGAGLFAAGALGIGLRRRFNPSATAGMEDFTARVDALRGSVRGFELFLISVLALFLEVLLIRWHASELRAAAYFKNVTLLAAFLGLGLGFAAANRARLSLLVAAPALAVQVIVLTVLGMRGADELLRMPTTEWIWGVQRAEWDWDNPASAQTRYWLQSGVFYAFFATLFVSTILIFIPLGQLTGRLMRGFTPIKAYTINILGSLAGVVLFGAVSYLWWPPAVWFAIAGGLLIWCLRHERFGATLAGISLVALFAAVAAEDRTGTKHSIYTPYQRLEVESERLVDETGRRLDTGVLISANKAYHLRTVNLARDFVAANAQRFPRLAQMASAYDLPHAFVDRPANVLVIGAGGGNDVAAALRNGAQHVDAVEIDPGIVELGRRAHAEGPYDDPRVTVHIDDARAFMRHAPDDAYDLIVFGLLDSHTLLSGMAAVRLDNYVYTTESLAETRRLLKPDGTLVLSFATGTKYYLSTRLYNMIETAFGHPPRCFELEYDDGLAYVAGRGATDPSLLAGDARETTVELEAGITPATDDWPFLYLPGREWHQLPKPYFVLIGLLALISVVWILAGSGRATGISPHFFFLGGAFLLIEVKGITELALVFGTTWIVSSVVIAAILTLILLANLFVTVFPRQKPALHYAFLAFSLVVGWFVPVSGLLAYGWWTAAVGSTTLLVLPLFFAGVIFATSLKQAASLPRVFASNLLGAILGGLCEYSSMAIGFGNLYLIGLALYALSFLTMPRGRAVQQPEPIANREVRGEVPAATTGGEAA